jgi:hypothetical protein
METTFTQINHDWENLGVGRRCPADDFVVTYNGFIRVPSSGTYEFYTSTDDGFRLQIGTELVIDDWQDQGFEEYNAEGEVTLVANRRYKLQGWLYENAGGAGARLYYSVDGSDEEIVPADWFSSR